MNRLVIMSAGVRWRHPTVLCCVRTLLKSGLLHNLFPEQYYIYLLQLLQSALHIYKNCCRLRLQRCNWQIISIELYSFHGNCVTTDLVALYKSYLSEQNSIINKYWNWLTYPFHITRVTIAQIYTSRVQFHKLFRCPTSTFVILRMFKNF